MPNSYFRFKHFTIQQNACAMKVCTDSCLFGAWTVAHFLNHNPETKSILDIGSGTGLLSLMLTQKLFSATIDAVEIESACFTQSEHNIYQSPWRDRIKIYNEDIKTFSPHKQYDVIISNPPFYEASLTSTNSKKNTAHHDTGLMLQSLRTVVKDLLADSGHFAILLPYFRASEFENAMHEESFFTIQKTFVRQTCKHPFFRVMFLLSRERKEVQENEIIIKESNGSYSAEFISLLKDYYLRF